MNSLVKYFTLIIFIAAIAISVNAAPPAPWEVEGLIGGKAPDFNLPDMEGNMVSISDFKQKVIFINFWATWCPPCKTEMPDLNELYKIYKDKDFVLIGISTDNSKKDIEKFLKDQNIDFILLHDKDGKIMKAYKVFSLPMSFLIDRDKKIVEKFLGPRDWTDEEFTKKIDALLR
ncbi:MAG: TlpA family protein disulfide reductase [Nitrospirota bacterium]|nr:MAG: TlpA family protein disulfide reductase [Nitrospirota bacterium]